MFFSWEEGERLLIIINHRVSHRSMGNPAVENASFIILTKKIFIILYL